MKGTLESAEMEKAAGTSILRSDFLILPLISLLTILVPALLGESIARLIWTESTDDACLTDDALGPRHKPNCSSSLKIAEGHWVQYNYNECGYRGSDPCGPKPPGTDRFVLVGTSIAEGVHVAEQDLFTSRVAPQLSHILGRKVEFQNMGSIGRLRDQYLLDEEVLRLQPDRVILLLVPYDLVRLDVPAPPTNQASGQRLPQLPDLASLVRSSRALFMLQHFVLQDEYYSARAFAVKSNPDDSSRVTPSPLAQRRYDRMNLVIHRVADDFRSHGVPLVVIAFPNRLQAIAISRNTQAPGLDAESFSRRVADMTRDAGADFVDVLPALKQSHDVAEMFYTIDGHLGGAGHKIIAQAFLDYCKSHAQRDLPAAR